MLSRAGAFEPGPPDGVPAAELRALTAGRSESAALTVDGLRLTAVPVAVDPGNANRWAVVAFAFAPADTQAWYRSVGPAAVSMAVAAGLLLLLADRLEPALLLSRRRGTTCVVMLTTSTGSRRSTTPWATSTGTSCSGSWPPGCSASSATPTPSPASEVTSSRCSCPRSPGRPTSSSWHGECGRAARAVHRRRHRPERRGERRGRPVPAARPGRRGPDAGRRRGHGRGPQRRGPWSAGTTPSGGSCRPRTSCPWPRAPARSCR